MNRKLNSDMHPARDELTRHAFSETAGEQRATVEAHLSECPECAEEVAGLRNTLSLLDRWQIPPAPQRRRSFNWQPLKWVAAAVILLGVGLGLGRFTAPSNPEIPALRAEIKADLERAIATEIQNQLAPALNAGLETALAAAREEDHAYVLALFRNLQREQASQFVSLRNDLETLATLTEEEILDARRSILRVAAFSQTASSEPK